jgi:hypothetical protein
LLSTYPEQAYWESAQAVKEAETIKRRERVIRRWTNLVQGLQTRKRLFKDYGHTEVAVSLPADEVDSLFPILNDVEFATGFTGPWRIPHRV